MTTDNRAERFTDEPLPDFLLPEPQYLSEAPRWKSHDEERPTSFANVPGEPGLWFFILGDMALFGVFFVAFLAAMRQDPDTFAASASTLDTWSGMTNTIVLLVSSFCVVGALRQRRTPSARWSVALLLLASGLGVTFAAVKLGEYIHLTALDRTPSTDLFYTYYFVLTGIHLLHVFIGICLLLLLAVRAWRGNASTRFFEGSCAYWHMVDALWMVLFPILYLVPSR